MAWRRWSAPVAKNPDGSSITGRVLARFSDMPADATTLPILRGGVAGTADPASLDTSKATLTRRTSEDGKLVPLRDTRLGVRRLQPGSFSRQTRSAEALPEGRVQSRLFVRAGVYRQGSESLWHRLRCDARFELVPSLRRPGRYRRGQPFARTHHRDGEPGQLAVGKLSSQLYSSGFNQDETGRIVFDGSNPNIAARQQAMNFRFAAPSGAAAMYETGSDGVVWWEDYTDEARHHPTAGLLDRCRATETCPKIVETFGSSEFFNLRASPDLVGTRADRDIPLPSNVRRYYFPGVSHGGGPGGFDPDPQRQACCELTPNPNPSSDTLRALQTALVDWVVKGSLPPPSQYPRLDRGELVAPTQAAMGFPAIPGVPFPDGILTPFYPIRLRTAVPLQRLCRASSRCSHLRSVRFCPRWFRAWMRTGMKWRAWPASSIRFLWGRIPAGTPTPVVSTKGTSGPIPGGFVPFAKTKAERIASGDPRLSLEERYGTHEKYVAQVRAAAERLVRGRYLLQEDADRLIAQAEASKVLK